MKLTATVLLFALTIEASFGQTLKTYSGSYEGGQATYQYYENTDLERIFSGKFSYSDKRDNVNLSGAHIPSGIEISGSFKENLKDGAWIAKEVLNSVVPQHGNVAVTMTFSGNFRNGKRQGQWVYKQKVTTSKLAENNTAVLNFNDNILIGKVEFGDMSGNLDDKGNFIQTWNVKEKGIEYLAEFKNNVFVKLIKRKISDGQILFKYDNRNMVDLIQNKIQLDGEPLEVDGKRYVLIDCGNFNNFYNEDNQYDRDDELFLEFYKVIYAKAKAFDRTIKRIARGSTEYTIVRPQVVKQLKGLTNKEIEVKKVREIEEERISERKEAEEKEQQELKEAKRRQEQEEEFKRQEKINAFLETDYGKLQEKIKRKYKIWMVKSDFESAADYELRLKNEAKERFKALSEEMVGEEKKSRLRIRYSDLRDYDAESQTYIIAFGNNETISMPMAKSFAPLFAATFANKQGRNDRSVIYVLPTEVVMVNNKWTVSEAVVLFDNYWSNADFVRDEEFKRFYKDKDSYFYEREYSNLDKMAKDIRKYKIEDLLKFTGSKELPKQVFFYEWKLQPPIANVQSLQFSFEDLHIENPGVYNAQ